MEQRKQKKQKKLNNGGFSLLELIVVIAIMGVLIAIAVASSSVIDGSRVRDAEQGISDYVSLTRTKAMSVAAKEWYFCVTKDDNEYVARIYKTTEVEDSLTTELVYEYGLGEKVTIYYGSKTTELAEANKIDSTKPLMIYFNPSTGRATKVKLGDTEEDIVAGLGYFRIVSGSYDATVKVFLNTGKCEREE